MIRPDIWMDAMTASTLYPGVRQYGVGKPVHYYHIVCEDYLQDNLIAEGMISETLGTTKYLGGYKRVYTWNKTLGGYTRIGKSELALCASC